jgi:ubiquinone/menaquinone biosynthesis C-methylase UbiE
VQLCSCSIAFSDHREAPDLSQSSDEGADHFDPYRNIADFYDLEHDQYRDDLALIHHLVEMVGDPVLELGCGTGRVLHHLLDLKMLLTGVDTSTAMLQRARQRLKSVNDITLAQVDMGSTGLPGDHFGIVIVALNSLLHATTSEKQRGVLAECFRVLDPRGLLFIDLPNPHAGTFDFTDHQLVSEGSWPLADSATVSKFSARTIDRAKQRIATTLWYDVVRRDGELRRHTSLFELRFLYPSELLLMLELAGFVEWQTYGTYELDPFTDSSPRFIVTAEKTPGR